MSKKRSKITFASVFAVLLMICMSLAVFGISPTNAEDGDVTVTVYANEGGSVTVGGDTINANSSKAIQAQPHSILELSAQPVEGFVFAYWYEGNENTPITIGSGYENSEQYLAYNEKLSYTADASHNEIHAKFFKKDQKQPVVTTKFSGGEWIKDGDSDVYKFDSSKVEVPQDYQNHSYPLVYEFLGEKWFDVKCAYDQGMAIGNFYINDNGVRIAKHDVPFMSSEILTELIKANGDCYHRIEFNPDLNIVTTIKIEVTIKEKTEDEIISEKGSVQGLIKFDSRLGDVFYLEGIEEENISKGFAVRYGTKATISDDVVATITVPKDIPVVFFAVEKDKVDSTIDPEQQTTVYNGGIGIGSAIDGKYKVTQTFTGEPEQPIVAEFKEVAILPKVTGTKTVNNVDGGTEEIQDGSTIKFDYFDNNSLLVKIALFSAIAKEQQKFAITVNGTEQPYEEYESDVGFMLNGIKETKNVVITPNYGEQYKSKSFTFKIEMEIEGEINNVVSTSSDPISEVINDETAPWFFDPAYNGENDAYAFSSGITSGTGNALSQVGFTVEVNGTCSVVGEFYCDKNDSGVTNGAVLMGYKIGDKFMPQNGSTFTANDFNYAKGFEHPDNATLFSTNSQTTTTGDDFVVRQIDDTNWYSFQITVNATGKTTIWLANAVASQYSWTNHVTIRNIAIYTGDAFATWEVEGNGAESEYTVTGMPEKGKTSPGTVLELKATPTQGHTFYGWKIVSGTSHDSEVTSIAATTDENIDWDEENAKFVSFEPTYRYTVGSGCSKIVAVIDNTSTYAVRNGDKLYSPDEVGTALKAAAEGSDKNVIVVDSFEITDESLGNDVKLEIPAGVNLVIPFDRAGSYYAMGTSTTASSAVSWASSGQYKDPVYKVTVAKDTTVTVNGALYVGGVLHYPDQSAQGHTSGAYSELVLNGKISVENGGVTDVYGRVTGDGSIDVQSGGVLYQPFLILDYAGGQNTYGLFSLNQTPFKRYAMINIQCKGGYKINYGGELWGHASLYFWSATTTLDTQFISFKGTINSGTDKEKKGTTTLINLVGTGAYAHGVYDDTHKKPEDTANGESIGHTTLTISGGAFAGYMDFLGMVQTDKVAFSIPYNYDLILDQGTFDMDYAYKLMPGASLTVNKNATLNINKEFYVYDGLIQSKISGKGYPTAEALGKADYLTNANFIVNGKLNIGDKATFFGAIQSKEENATITTATGATLTGKIVDGGITDYDCNQSEYESSARVWDAAHDVIATLKAGKTYKSLTTTENESWTLPETTVEYESGEFGSAQAMKSHQDHASSTTFKKDGKTKPVTTMKGSWKLEHTNHNYTWGEADLESQAADDWESQASSTPYRKGIKHQCSELGCEVSDEKTVVYAPEVTYSENTFEEFNYFTYDGTPWTEEDIKELLTKYYTKEDAKARNIRLLAANAQPSVTIKVEGTGAQNGQMFKYGTYSVTITLNDDNYIWLINDDGQDRSGVYTFSNTFTFTLEVKAHTLSENDITVADNVTYKGADFSLDDLKASVSIGGNKLPTSDYEITITGDKKNAGTLTLKFSPKGQNVTGEAIEKTVTIAQKEATIKAVDKNSPEKEDKVDLTVTQSGILGVDNDVWTEIQKHLKLTVTKDGKEVDFNTVKDGDKLTITVTWDNETSATKYAKNYNITFATGTYTITSAVFKDVKFENKEVTYNGQKQKLEATGTEDGMECTYTYTAKNGTKTVNNSNEGVKDAGTYEVKVNITYEKEGKHYSTELTATLTITKKNVTVTITPQSVEYDGNTHSFDTTKDKQWYTVDGICDGDNITFTAKTKNEGKDAKTYAIDVTPSGDAKDNYDFKYDDADKALTITKKVIKVSVKDLTSVYGEAIKAFESTIEGTVVASDTTIDITNYLEYTCDVPTNKNAGTYKITLTTKDTNQLTNYDIKIVDGEGTYTINKRDITITIEDQNDVYGYNKNYNWKADGWTVDEATTLAKGDDRTALKVQLVKPYLTVANKYDITAICGNANYNVTFVKGTYTLAKQHIEHNGQTVIFVLQVDGEDFHNETFKFEGKDFVLSATVYVKEKEMIPLNYTLNLEKLTKPGSYKVIVTVNDERYEGSAEYAIDILTAEGFSQNLFDVLTKLEEIAGDAEADLLTATEENFALVKAVKAELNKLSDEELEMGEAELVRYVALVETWDDAANIDAGVIESAKALADSPLRWLFVVTQMSSLICALYVIGKGGLLLL